MLPNLLRKLKIITLNLIRGGGLASISLLSLLFGSAAGPAQRRILSWIGVKTLGKVFIGREVRIQAPQRLTLGRGVAIGDRTHIACHAEIEIGDGFIGAPGVMINSGQHDVRTLEGFGVPIKIGSRVWCGAGVIICAGVEIGDDAVIGAGAVVVRSIPSGSVAVGIPARVVKRIQGGQEGA